MPRRGSVTKFKTRWGLSTRKLLSYGMVVPYIVCSPVPKANKHMRSRRKRNGEMLGKGKRDFGGTAVNGNGLQSTANNGS